MGAGLIFLMFGLAGMAGFGLMASDDGAEDMFEEEDMQIDDTNNTRPDDPADDPDTDLPDDDDGTGDDTDPGDDDGNNDDDDDELDPPLPGADAIFDDDDGFDDGVVLATDGNDVLYGGLRGNFPASELTDTTTPNDTIFGLLGNDQIFGGLGRDTLDGGAGEDSIFGGAGDDEIRGGNDADYIEAGDDNDRVFAGDGDDEIDGGAGNDFLRGEGGSDIVRGGDGDDILANASSTGIDTLIGGAGNDVLGPDNSLGLGNIMTGGTGDDFFGTVRGGRVITDFGDDSGGSGDGDTLNNDYMDLWQRYDTLAEAKADLDANGALTKPYFGETIVEGLTSADLTEDNTGLSDVPGFAHADIQVIFREGDDKISVVQRPIINGNATLSLDWGDGTFERPSLMDQEFMSKTYDIPGVYDLTYTVASLADGGMTDTVIYRIDTINRTLEFIDPDGQP